MKVHVKNKFIRFPMPVLLVSTYDENGNIDVMNAAWGTLEDHDVILIQLAADHKTSSNIEKTHAFTVANATLPYVKSADYVGIVSLNDEPHKIEKSGFHFHRSTCVNAPCIDELPVTLECEVIRIDRTNGDFAVYGKIVGVEVDDSYLDEKGNLDMDRCQFLTFHMADHSYRVISEKCETAYQCGISLK